MLETHKQIRLLIDKSKNILICFRKNYTIDSVASALALNLWLEKQNKIATTACADFETQEQIKFLPKIDTIKKEIINLRKFVINLNLEKSSVEEFSYEINEKKLKIYITPKGDFFKAEDVEFTSTEFRFDLILNCDTPNPESLSSLFEKNREFFYATPIINFDHNPHNEHYGQINIIDLKAVSCSQVVYEFLKQNNEKMIDEQIATCLLVGIFDKTNSFKTKNITPKCLEVVSNLIKTGARRELIVKNLYQSKPLSTLKLWGRILARLNQDKSIKLVWSLLSHDDFVKSGAGKQDVRGVVDELIKSLPDSEIILILYEIPTSKSEQGELKICGQIFTTPNYDSMELAHSFRAEGTKELAKFCLENVKLLEAEKKVIDEIRKKLEK